MSLISNVLKFAPKVEDAVLGFLPAALADKVKGARKAIYGAAVASVGVLAALEKMPFLPPQFSAVVAVASIVATGIVTYWAPNAA